MKQAEVRGGDRDIHPETPAAPLPQFQPVLAAEGRLAASQNLRRNVFFSADLIFVKIMIYIFKKNIYCLILQTNAELF